MGKKNFIRNISKLTLSQLRKEYTGLLDEYDTVTKGVYCHECATFKPKDKFYKGYKSNASGVVPICKECLYQIATNYNTVTKEEHCTKESVMKALRMADLPYIQNVYDAAISESTKVLSGNVKSNAWTAYIKNIQSLHQYHGKGWFDSDMYQTGYAAALEEEIRRASVDTDKATEINEMYAINRRNVLKALGYDPFETASESDKPLMYNKLSNMLDEDTSDDEVKLAACVEIVHSFNQAEKYNFVINDLQRSRDSCINNASTIKTLSDTKGKIYKSMLDLAKENGITVNSSSKGAKGSNTWTNKVKEMKELKLRESEVNLFDIGTSDGMKQVADISTSAILKQIRLDENDYTDMIAQQLNMIKDLQKRCDTSEETARILKRENSDLKDFLREKKMINERDEVIV